MTIFNGLGDNAQIANVLPTNDSINHLYLSWSDMLDVMSKLKAGKASASFVKAEHILYGSPKLAFHLHLS